MDARTRAGRALPLGERRVLAAADRTRPRPGHAWIGAVAAAVLLSLGLAGFSRVAAEAAQSSCSGALCAEPVLAVVDDPQVPLYQSLEALAALEGDAGCWEALADLDGPR